MAGRKITKMTTTIEKLVEKGKISADSAERMKKKGVTEVDELYCLINSVTTDGDDELNMELAGELQIPQGESENPREKLKDYMGCLKPYITQKQVRRLNQTDSQTQEPKQKVQETEMQIFYRKHRDFGKD